MERIKTTQLNWNTFSEMNGFNIIEIKQEN